jgi:hypothetical protein
MDKDETAFRELLATELVKTAGALSDELDETKAALAATRRELDETRAELALTRGSISWRYTGWLRAVARILSKR